MSSTAENSDSLISKPSILKSNPKAEGDNAKANPKTSRSIEFEEKIDNLQINIDTASDDDYDDDSSIDSTTLTPRSIGVSSPIPLRKRRFTAQSLPKVWQIMQESKPESSSFLDLSDLYAKLNDMEYEIDNVKHSAAMRLSSEESDTVGGDAEVDEELDPNKLITISSQTISGGAARMSDLELRIRKGQLYKKCSGTGSFSNRSWKKRYFRLQDDFTLVYFKNEEEYKRGSPPKKTAVINKDTVISKGRAVTPGRSKKGKYQYEFQIVNKGHVLSLATDTSTTQDLWVHTLNTCIQGKVSAATPRTVVETITQGETFIQSQELAQSCTAHGTGLYDGYVGDESSFVIVSNDILGNQLRSGGLDYKIYLSNDEMQYDLDVQDNFDGTYSSSYSTRTVGEYDLSIMYNGFHIVGSPFHPIIHSDKTNAPKCVAAGDSLVRCETRRVEYFVIYARTQFDEPQAKPGDNFIVDIQGPGKVLEVLDNQNGTYTCSFQIDASEEFMHKAGLPTVTLSVLLNDGSGMKTLLPTEHIDDKVRYTRAPRHIYGSPFTPVIYNPGTSGVQAGPPSITLSQHTLENEEPNVSVYKSEPEMITSPLTNNLTSIDHNNTLNHSIHSKSSSSGPGTIDPELIRLALEEKQRGIEEEYAKLIDMRRKLEDDRAEVNQQMQRISEMGQRINLDSQRLANEAVELGIRPKKAPSRRPPEVNTSRDSHFETSKLTSVSSTSRSNRKRTPSRKSPLPPAAYGGSPSYSISTNNNRERKTTRDHLLVGLDIPQEEIFDADVSNLLDLHNHNLYNLFCAYASKKHLSADEAVISGSQLIKLASDYDIAPTFLQQNELKTIIKFVLRESSNELNSMLFPDFVETLVRCAIVALSKPVFNHLYKRTVDKVAVLLEMWGLADPVKLEEIVREK